MKLFVAASLLFIGSSVFATPKVGDYADYDIVITHYGMDYPIDYSLEILSFNAEDNTYQERVVNNYLGDPKISIQSVSAAALYSDSLISNILANCLLYHGVHETTATPAGTYDACKVTLKFVDHVSTQWIAHVPFGLIKEIQLKINGDAQTLVIKSFKDFSEKTTIVAP